MSCALDSFVVGFSLLAQLSQGLTAPEDVDLCCLPVIPASASPVELLASHFKELHRPCQHPRLLNLSPGNFLGCNTKAMSICSGFHRLIAVTDITGNTGQLFSPKA